MISLFVHLSCLDLTSGLFVCLQQMAQTAGGTDAIGGNFELGMVAVGGTSFLGRSCEVQGPDGFAMIPLPWIPW